MSQINIDDKWTLVDLDNATYVINDTRVNWFDYGNLTFEGKGTQNSELRINENNEYFMTL